MKSLRLRLATSEQHAELIKMYSSPHAPESPLVINSRTVSKITSTFHPLPLPPPPRINLDNCFDMAKESSDVGTHYDTAKDNFNDAPGCTASINQLSDESRTPPTPKVYKRPHLSSK